MPRRAADVVAGGSLYWVIGGAMLVRQCVLGIEPACREDGTACAAILLNAALVAVAPRPVKAFQGWRYLDGADAPEDLRTDAVEAGLPFGLAKQLRELGLL